MRLHTVATSRVSANIFPIQGSVSTSEIFAEARICWSPRSSSDGWRSKAPSRSPGTEIAKQFFDRRLKDRAGPDRRQGIAVPRQPATREPRPQRPGTFYAPPGDAFFRDPCAGTHAAASETQCALTGVTPGQYGHIACVNAAASATIRSLAATTTCNQKIRPLAPPASSFSPAPFEASTQLSTGGASGSTMPSRRRRPDHHQQLHCHRRPHLLWPRSPRPEWIALAHQRPCRRPPRQHRRRPRRN